MCRGVSHTPSMAGMSHVRRCCFVRCYRFLFAHFRAYAIRPYTCSVEIEAILGYVLIPFSLVSGRMRYAPTVVREKQRTIHRKNRTFAVIFSNHHGLTDARRKPSLLRVLASIRNIPIINNIKQTLKWEEINSRQPRLLPSANCSA